MTCGKFLIIHYPLYIQTRTLYFAPIKKCLANHAFVFYIFFEMTARFMKYAIYHMMLNYIVCHINIFSFVFYISRISLQSCSTTWPNLCHQLFFSENRPLNPDLQSWICQGRNTRAGKSGSPEMLPSSSPVPLAAHSSWLDCCAASYLRTIRHVSCKLLQFAAFISLSVARHPRSPEFSPHGLFRARRVLTLC